MPLRLGQTADHPPPTRRRKAGGDTGRRAADVIVTARVAARQGDDLRLEVESVERGRVRRRPIVRSFGVQLRPWREYRLWLFRAGGRPNLSREAEPEALDFTRPVSVAALGALPQPLRWGIAATPPFLAATTALALRDRRERRSYDRRRR